MSARIFPVVAIGLLVLSGAYAVDSSLSRAGAETTIENESFTPSVGVVQLNQSERNVTYDKEVRVVDENGTRMVAGEDYDWIYKNGTIEVLSGGKLDGDSSAEITYTFRYTSERQDEVGDLFGSGFEILGLLIIALAAAAVLSALGALS